MKSRAQLAKGRVLSELPAAELKLLRRHGFRVACICEHDWHFAGDAAAARANKLLVADALARLA